MTKKPTPKKNTKKTAPASSPATSSAKPSRRKRLWGFAWKFSLAMAAILFVAGVYLNSVVKQKFSGQLFQIPTVVYARILTLEPGMNISLKEVRNELDVLKYRKVRHPRYPGEYSASSTRIELIRRLVFVVAT